MNIRQITRCAIFTGVIAILAQLSIMLPSGVPITMQTFAVALAGVVLGSKYGFFASLVYILLGAAGVPVFANFTGGLQIVLGPTGGFILSFPLMSFIIGYVSERTANMKKIGFAIAAGTLLNYLAGMVYFSFSTGSTMLNAFIWCILPYLATDVIKLAAAGIIGVRLKKAVSFGLNLL